MAKRTSKARRRRKTSIDTVNRVGTLMDDLFKEDIHAKRLKSLKNGVIGVVEAGALNIHAIGRGLAAVNGLLDKHAVKQVDRLIGNEKFDCPLLQAIWPHAESKYRVADKRGG